MVRMRAGFVAVAAMAVMLPAGVRAQGNAPTADELVARAQALYTQPSMYGVAATLFQRSARMRQPGDARAVDALSMAGRLYSYAGELGRGRKAMEKAGELALQSGDVIGAANAYADAAFIAADQHSKRAADLAKRVLWLADTAPIPAYQRDEIRGRLGPVVIAALRQQAGEVAGV